MNEDWVTSENVEPLIQFEGVGFYFREDLSSREILKNLSFSIGRGERLALLGPSGSGKSTSLYLLGLMEKPTSGRIFFHGRNVESFSENEMAQFRNENIGFVFQQFHLMPRLSIRENILLPLWYSSQRTEEASILRRLQELTEFLGIAGILDRMPNEISGGQQQRAAICRALILNPEIVLADEPTGNLDTKNAQQVLEILDSINSKYGKTVVIITHDPSVAARSTRCVVLRDGAIESDSAPQEFSPSFRASQKIYDIKRDSEKRTWNSWIQDLRLSLRNLARSRLRTGLTMLGIVVGIAAVYSMLALGQFTQEKILSGYSDLGVNTMTLSGYRNWQQRATDVNPRNFQFFNWQKDFANLREVFPSIQRMSPLYVGWNLQVQYGGRTVDREVVLLAVNENALFLNRRTLLRGRNFTPLDIDRRSQVCLIGEELAVRLFQNRDPLGRVLTLIQSESLFSCRVIGVLSRASSSKEYMKPNQQVWMPFTYYKLLGADWWSVQLKEVLIELKPGFSVDKQGFGISKYFAHRYGNSGIFHLDSNSILVAHMKTFLTLFTILLTAVALVTLSVGGMGIANLMLASVAERLREFGLRRALGARPDEIRRMVLLESVSMCLVSGVLGCFVGLGVFHLALWFGTHLVKDLKFGLHFNGLAFCVASLSTLGVGIAAGYLPALKAQRLSIVQALRSE